MELITPVFDVVLPVALKDVDNIDWCIRTIFANINPQRIVIIANKQIENRIPQPRLDKIVFYDEDTLLAGLTLNRIKEIMLEIVGFETRSNWYFQQFLKMAYAYISPFENYLIWDSDTIPLNKIQFFRKENGEEKYLFAISNVYHKPYFNTLRTLFNGRLKRLTKKSFIVEHMMINKNIMKEIIQDIESNAGIKGNYFFEKILYSINKDEIAYAGFSEFETYGNYLLNYYPNFYGIRRLRTYRQGAMVINKIQINEDVLNWIAKDQDTISFEDGHGHNKFFLRLRDKCTCFVEKRTISFRMYQSIFSILEQIVLMTYKLKIRNIFRF